MTDYEFNLYLYYITSSKQNIRVKNINMPCSKLRKANCIAQKDECTWIVGKGCRRNQAKDSKPPSKPKSAKSAKPAKSFKSATMDTGEQTYHKIRKHLSQQNAKTFFLQIPRIFMKNIVITKVLSSREDEIPVEIYQTTWTLKSGKPMQMYVKNLIYPGGEIEVWTTAVVSEKKQRTLLKYMQSTSDLDPEYSFGDKVISILCNEPEIFIDMKDKPSNHAHIFFWFLFALHIWQTSFPTTYRKLHTVIDKERVVSMVNKRPMKQMTLREFLAVHEVYFTM